MKEKFISVEGVLVPIWVRSYEECHGITLCCVILNEEKGIKDFLEYYKPYVQSIVMVDGGSKDRTVEIASTIVDEIKIRPFDGHYSNQANKAFEMTRTDWILLMDCDERLEKKSLENLGVLINQEEVDCYSFPRKNYLDGVYDEQHYPDYQDRLYRSYCRRVRPVHGEVVGYKNRKFLSTEEGNFIIHSKASNIHTIRNNNYLLYEMKFKHEMGEPGTQSMNSFNNKYPQLKEDNFIIK
jgi:glycosyltransferase involved in cell wall biosynthesis